MYNRIIGVNHLFNYHAINNSSQNSYMRTKSWEYGIFLHLRDAFHYVVLPGIIITGAKLLQKKSNIIFANKTVFQNILLNYANAN